MVFNIRYADWIRNASYELFFDHFGKDLDGFFIAKNKEDGSADIQLETLSDLVALSQKLGCRLIVDGRDSKPTIRICSTDK